MESNSKPHILTQKKIAQALGISLVTVNRALNNSGCVSPKLKKQILDYVKKNDYIPVRVSQVLLRNKVRTIVVFSSSSPEYFWDDIYRGIKTAGDQIKAFNYEVRYRRIPDLDTAAYIAILEEEIQRGVDAIALVNQWLYDMDTIIAEIEKAAIPYIFYNTDGRDYQRLCYIGTDYRSGGRLAANVMGKALVIKRNARAMVIAIDDTSYNREIKPDINTDRLMGFLDAMKEEYPEIEILTEVMVPKSEKSKEAQIQSFLKIHEHQIDGLYIIPSFNSAYVWNFENLDYKNVFTIRTDLDALSLEHLKNDLLSVVIYQDPFLQGYQAVRFLEMVLENNIRDRQDDIEISHNVIFKENTGILHRFKEMV
ncbi:MAG: substrate-binding domain-containing protein [Treponema sp.]|jgi:LacI family transcriptional regulator|nr:substrate-binding domain-containing protein [Treponema sp.]